MISNLKFQLQAGDGDEIKTPGIFSIQQLIHISLQSGNCMIASGLRHVSSGEQALHSQSYCLPKYEPSVSNLEDLEARRGLHGEEQHPSRLGCFVRHARSRDVRSEISNLGIRRIFHTTTTIQHYCFTAIAMRYGHSPLPCVSVSLYC